MPDSSIPIPTSPDLSPTDLSNMAFAKLFGENWWQVGERLTDTFTGPIIPILSAMNTLLFTFVCGYSLYAFVVGSVGTASSGSIGGKLNNFWWPLRASFGMSMTAPLTAGGLSIFQVLILGALGWACTFANNIYEHSIDHLANSHFMVLEAEAPPQIQENASAAARLIFQATSAQFFISKKQQDLADDLVANGKEPNFEPWKDFKTFSVDKATEDPVSLGWELEFATPPELHAGDLGGFKIPEQAGASSKTTDPLMLAQRNGLLAMSAIIAPAARDIVYGGEPKEGWLNAGIKAYEREVLPVYANFFEYYPEHDLSQDNTAFKKEAKELGWMAAGAMPLRMSSMSVAALDKINQEVTILAGDVDSVVEQFEDEKYKAFSATMAKASSRLEAENDLTEASSAIGHIKEGNFGDAIASFITGRIALESLVDRFENEDPALVFGQFGHMLVNAGIAAWTAGATLATLEGANEGFAESFSGKAIDLITFGASDTVQGGIRGLLEYLGKWLSVLCAGLFTAGLIFAYILPAVPTLYWILAMAGFLLLVLEVMVAAPFWAAAHAWSIQDEGLAGEMGKQGYFQVLEVLFRPALYILGFIGIFLIMRVTGWLTAQIFRTLYHSYALAEFGFTGGTTTGLITSIVMALILGGVFLYLNMYLCSEGYSHLPRKVMSWIGHQSSTMGIAGGAEAMRQVIVGGVGRGTRSRKNANMLPGSSKKDNTGKPSNGGGDDGGKGNPHSTGESGDSSGKTRGGTKRL